MGEDQGFVFCVLQSPRGARNPREAQHEVDCRGMLGLLSLLASYIASIVAYNPVTYVIRPCCRSFGFKVFGVAKYPKTQGVFL